MRPNIPKGPSMNEMIKQAQKMKEDMQAKQAELEEREYEVSAGGGAVKLKINGRREVLSLDISEEIVDPDDIETLSDILVAAVNEAIKKVDSASSEEMGKITGGIPGMGGMMGMPGLF